MTALEELENNPTKIYIEKGKAAPCLSLYFSELNYSNLFSFPTQTSVEIRQNNNSLWLKINPLSVLTATGRFCLVVVKKQVFIVSWYFRAVYSEYQ